MLSKKECLNALEILCNYADGNPSSSGEFVGKMLQEADDTLQELIEEHFELVELLKKHDLKKVEKPSLLINEEFVESKEMVDHPSHYNQGKREVIEEMRILFGDEAVESFCRLNAYKYLRRAEFKGNKKEDLEKAEWYMDYIEKMRGEE